MSGYAPTCSCIRPLERETPRQKENRSGKISKERERECGLVRWLRGKGSKGRRGGGWLGSIERWKSRDGGNRDPALREGFGWETDKELRKWDEMREVEGKELTMY